MIPVVWSEVQLRHVPAGEVWVGIRIEGTEVPERAEVIRAAVAAAGAEVFEPHPYPSSELETVHDPVFLRYLETAWAEWERSGYPIDPGMDRVVPYAFPLRQVTGDRTPRVAASIGARAGMFAMDTMTLIGPGTWEAAEAAARCALTAADLVADGAPAVYAACRPPGHHAGRDLYGGSCYLNNAALAAERLRQRGAGMVSVIDLDAHHGNGTQEIFYRRPDVLYGSVHVDPGRGWFPHFLGYADEYGAGPGADANLNFPLAPGAGDGPWLEAVDDLITFAARSDALVVSLGVDAAELDPETPLVVSAAGYAEAGRRIGLLEVPTVIVQEGGYHLRTLGDLVVGFLAGLGSTLARPP